MSDLRSDATLDQRIKALEAEIEADTARMQAKDAEAVAAKSEWRALTQGIKEKRAALAELRLAWTARGLPERTAKEVGP